MDEKLNADSQRSRGRANAEVIAFVSGKGGTGKTLLLASMAYALLEAGRSVCLVDTDLATQGLSLFILGRSAERGTSQLGEQNSLYHAVRSWGGSSFPRPKVVDRSRDHGHEYPLVVSNKQFYDRRISLAAQAEEENPLLLQESMGGVTDELVDRYPSFVSAFFSELAEQGYRDDEGRRHAVDYVLVDTRGGFGELTLVPAVHADSIVLVAEPDISSFHQLAKLLANIELMAKSFSRNPILRGALINKSLVHGEETFRSLLDVQFGIHFGLSWPIPLDRAAVEAYQTQQIPFRNSPESNFSAALIGAFTELFDIVTAPWSPSEKEKWRALEDQIVEARARREERTSRDREQDEARQAELETLRTEVEDARRTAGTSDERFRVLEREKRRRTLVAGVLLVIWILTAAVLGSLLALSRADFRRAERDVLELEQDVVELEQRAQELARTNARLEAELELERSQGQ